MWKQKWKNKFCQRQITAMWPFSLLHSLCRPRRFTFHKLYAHFHNDTMLMPLYVCTCMCVYASAAAMTVTTSHLWGCQLAVVAVPVYPLELLFLVYSGRCLSGGGIFSMPVKSCSHCFGANFWRWILKNIFFSFFFLSFHFIPYLLLLFIMRTTCGRRWHRIKYFTSECYSRMWENQRVTMLPM